MIPEWLGLAAAEPPLNPPPMINQMESGEQPIFVAQQLLMKTKLPPQPRVRAVALGNSRGGRGNGATVPHTWHL